jgi:hypothetical protein
LPSSVDGSGLSSGSGANGSSTTTLNAKTTAPVFSSSSLWAARHRPARALVSLFVSPGLPGHSTFQSSKPRTAARVKVGQLDNAPAIRMFDRIATAASTIFAPRDNLSMQADYVYTRISDSRYAMQKSDPRRNSRELKSARSRRLSSEDRNCRSLVATRRDKVPTALGKPSAWIDAYFGHSDSLRS